MILGLNMSLSPNLSGFKLFLLFRHGVHRELGRSIDAAWFSHSHRSAGGEWLQTQGTWNCHSSGCTLSSEASGARAILKKDKSQASLITPVPSVEFLLHCEEGTRAGVVDNWFFPRTPPQEPKPIENHENTGLPPRPGAPKNCGERFLNSATLATIPPPPP